MSVLKEWPNKTPGALAKTFCRYCVQFSAKTGSHNRVKWRAFIETLCRSTLRASYGEHKTRLDRSTNVRTHSDTPTNNGHLLNHMMSAL